MIVRERPDGAPIIEAFTDAIKTVNLPRLRPCTVNSRPAYFHQWIVVYEKLLAIVEFPDGSVSTCSIGAINFADRMDPPPWDE